MAKKITLFSPEDEKIKVWYNSIIDCVKSYTIIYDNTTGERYNFFDQFSHLDLTGHKTTIYYKSGFYFIVLR